MTMPDSGTQDAAGALGAHSKDAHGGPPHQENGADPGGSRTKDAGDQLDGSSIQGAAQRIGARASDIGARASDIGGKAYGTAADAASRATDYVGGTVQNQPVTAIALGIGFGFFLGYLAARKI